MMGSGKSTVGRRLAGELGRAYLDSDDQVCRRTGRSVREIFEADGEAAFRAEERRALAEAVASAEAAVIAVAGGAVLDPGNRCLLASAGTVVWLDAPPEVLAARVGGGAGSDHRPLLGDDPLGALRRLDGERRPLYAALADVTVDVSSCSAEDAVARIREALA